MAHHCEICGNRAYATLCFRHKKRKAIPKQSEREMNYQQWKEEICRPFLIKRDGNKCSCCKRPARQGEKLDIEHTKSKGSHPELKRDLRNMTLMCRIPCHSLKTVNKPCNH